MAMEESKPSRTEAEVIAELVASRYGRSLDDVPIVTHPPGYRTESLERLMAEPRRQRSRMVFDDIESFVTFAKQKGALHLTFFSEKTLAFTAIFDPDSWREDVAVCQLAYAPEWKKWNEASGKEMDQEAFAHFVEDNLPDILSPDGATMLEVANRLEAKKSVQFVSGVRQFDGSVEFSYTEETKASLGKGKLEVPERFTLMVPVFRLEKRCLLEARFRYRIRDGKLTTWFELMRPHVTRDEAIDATLVKVEAELTSVYRGDPGPNVAALMGVPAGPAKG
jgi:uncharacterized protein YfdQ (DUF2303 family)